ncbi:MAG: YbhB/YbcL family Raf kinase inhibitor-like protein [Deltaproteobacteria bacterium]|nr:YbhB/YbcL family Raf kinase inhibitor-like protein [Deltaproteobacteria bacterium]
MRARSAATGVVVGATALACAWGCTPKAQNGSAEAEPGKGGATLTVTSTAFKDGDPIPAQFACGVPRKDDCDLGTSPPLAWTAGPAQTKAYAVLVCDPDGHDWLHWVATDLPVSPTSLAQGASGHCKSQLPAGAKDLKNEFDQAGYGGPCPPAGSGVHHYVFTVYALPTPGISLPASTKCADHKAVLESKAIARGSLTGTYRIDR